MNQGKKNNALCLKQGQGLKTWGHTSSFVPPPPPPGIKPKRFFSAEGYHWIYAILPGMLRWREGPIFTWVTKLTVLI